MPINYWGNQNNLKRLEETKDRVVRLPTPGTNKSAPLRKKSIPKQAKTNGGMSSGGLSRGDTKNTASKNWTQQKFAGNMNVGNFVSLAGGLAQAISPNTSEGRAGGFMSNFANQNMAREDKANKESADRQTFLADRNALWTRQDKTAADAITAEETRYQRRKGEGLTEYNRRVAAEEKTYNRRLANTDYERYKTDPKGFAAYKAAGRVPITTLSSNKTTYYGKDGSEMVVKNEADVQEAIRNGMSRIKPGSKNGNKIATDLLKEYGGTFNDEGAEISPIEKLRTDASRGEPVAISDLIAVYQGKGILPKGANIPITDNNGNPIFFNQETGSYYDINGRKLKMAKPAPSKPDALRAEKEYKASQSYNEPPQSLRKGITPGMPGFGAGMSTAEGDKLFPADGDTPTSKEALKRFKEGAKKKVFNLRTRLYNR